MLISKAGEYRYKRTQKLAFASSVAHNRNMFAKVCSAAVNGIEAYPVEVEVNAGFGDTIIVIVVNKTPEAAIGQNDQIPPITKS